MKLHASIVKVLLWCCFLPGLSGCVPAALVVGAGAGAGTYAYVEGVSKAVYPLPFDRMWRETLAMLKEQQIGIVEQSREEGKGTIKGKRLDDKDVTVDLSVRGTQNTSVDIRLGLIPDREGAENLQRALARRVGVKLPL